VTTPGGDDFVKNARFGKTMKHFASTEGLDVTKDPEVDMEYVRWFVNRTIDYRRLMPAEPQVEIDADRSAVQLLARAGYDGHALEQVISLNSVGLIDLPQSTKLLELKPGGKAPAFPKALKWPQQP